MEKLEKKLLKLFEDKYTFVAHSNAIWCSLRDEESFLKVVQKFKELEARVCTVTCYSLDVGHEIVYHFDIDGVVVNLKVEVQNSSITSITDIFPSANWTERELSELYGIEIKNHPNPARLFLDESIKESILNDYISLSNAMNGKLAQHLWDKVKANQGNAND